MSGTTLTIQGHTLTRRASGTIGQARAVARLKREFGCDLLDGGDFEDLIYQPGGVHALLSIMFDGPVDEVNEEALQVEELTQVLQDFFGASGTPSTGLPDGSPPEPPSPSES